MGTPLPIDGNPSIRNRLEMEAPIPPHALRPGETILFAWRLLRASIAPVAVVSVAWVPVTWLEYRLVPSAADLLTTFLYLPLQIVFSMVHGSLAAAFFFLIGRKHLRGEPLTPLPLVKEALVAWPRVLWTQILVMPVVLLGLIALVVPGVYLAIRLVAAEPAAVFERRSGPAAFRRSFELSREHGGDLFVLGLVYAGIGLAFVAVILSIVSFFPYAESWPVVAVEYFCGGIAMAFFYFFILGVYEALRTGDGAEPGEG